MTKIKFNDGHPDEEIKILVKAESVILGKDSSDHFVLIKRSKVDESKEVEFSEDLEGLDSEVTDETTADVVELLQNQE